MELVKCVANLFFRMWSLEVRAFGDGEHVCCGGGPFWTSAVLWSHALRSVKARAEEKDSQVPAFLPVRSSGLRGVLEDFWQVGGRLRRGEFWSLACSKGEGMSSGYTGATSH